MEGDGRRAKERDRLGYRGEHRAAAGKGGRAAARRAGTVAAAEGPTRGRRAPCCLWAPSSATPSPPLNDIPLSLSSHTPAPCLPLISPRSASSTSSRPWYVPLRPPLVADWRAADHLRVAPSLAASSKRSTSSPPSRRSRWAQRRALTSAHSSPSSTARLATRPCSPQPDGSSSSARRRAKSTRSTRSCVQTHRSLARSL